MVISITRLVSSPKRHLEVLEILRSVVGPTANGPGCLHCGICKEDGPDQTVLLCSYWKSPAALHEHILTDLYARILAACELLDEPPEFSFYHVKRTEGIELIYKLRGHTREQEMEDSVKPKPEGTKLRTRKYLL